MESLLRWDEPSRARRIALQRARRARAALAGLALLVGLALVLAPSRSGGRLPLEGSRPPLKPTSGGKHRALPRDPSFGPPIERPVFRPSYRPEMSNPPLPASPRNASEVCSWQSYRLPTYVRPVAYNLTIELPSLIAPAFVYGAVDIMLRRNASAPAPLCLVFHVAPEMQIDALSLTLPPRAAREGGAGGAAGAGTGGAEPGRSVGARISRYDPEWSQMHVQLDEPVDGEAVLSLLFSYELRDKLTGLYHSRFTGADGAQHSIATTQHEATSARETFPCWDEPAFKASFRLTLHVPDANGSVALSNMPQLEARALAVPRTPPRVASSVVAAPAATGGAAAGAAMGGAGAAMGGATTALWAQGAGPPDESLRAGRPLAPAGQRRAQLPLKRVAFDASPNMSTYLVAFTVGAFEALTTVTPSGVRISAWAPAATRQVSKLRYALDLARDALSLYESLLQVPFPLPKIDIVSIPDFGPGAMENWGLLTYRATSVQADEHSAPADRQAVACTVVHELGHQWTGNLVTMRWWDELWLNEGFANFFEQAVTDLVAPELMIGKQHVQYLSTALFYDGSFDTHAVRPSSSVSSDAGIEALFDSISYDKAGAIIFMLHDYLQRRRPGAFVKGLKAYLTEHEYGSASGADMWAHLGEASELPVAAWVEPWFSQAGFPLIEVTTLSDGSAVLLQTGRFTQDLTRAQVAFGGRAGGGDQAERTPSWWVPVSYLTSVSPEVSVGEIGSASQFLSIPPTLKPRGGFDAEGADWLKVNFEGAGYYRVNYEPHMWARLVQAAAEHRLSDADLANLIDDAFALTFDGRLAGVALSLARALGVRTAHESDTLLTSSYESWQAMSAGLSLVLGLLTDAAQAASSAEGLVAGPGLELIPRRCAQDLQRFVRTQALGRCLDPLLGAPPGGRPPSRDAAASARRGDGAPASSSQLEELAKPVLLRLGAAMADVRVGAWASAPLQPCLASPDARCEAIASIPPELRFACLEICAGADVHGGCWRLMLGQLAHADNEPALRYALLTALSRAPTAGLLNATLGLVLNSTAVRAQDIGAMLSMLASNPRLPGARLAVWEFAKANAAALTAAAGGAGSFDFGGLIASVAGGFASEEMAQDVEGFLALTPEISEGVPARIVRAIVGRIRSQAIWLQSYGADTCAALASFHA